ncbi:creatinine amidohydrolase [Clostridium collagenovorans DSM 3089]|uniref:Creatinine amidohydrolase n=1 Tax=Clostridium collagenovorans DSM 3089 TaxID=1121306 RepID=A0A1M5YIP8_9CLOT|nr:creatininase [Clostridium collagenovorans]SHI11931.1 creatinine amidohydrolase [Clostridium collagenovorans DSM 3089]
MSFLMDHMTWMEFNEKKEESVVILPIGSTEQHGPHLPLSVDTVIAKEFSIALAKQINGMVAPTLSYGYKSQPLSGGGPLFPGTIDLNGETLIKLVEDILCELVKDGVKKILVLNAHFENEAFVLEAIDLVSNKYKDKVTIVETNWWDPMPEDVIDKVFDEVKFPGWAFEHAAITETSLMLYFAEELVHMDRMVDTKGATPCAYHKYPIEKSTIPESGVLATARTSTAEKGKIIVDSVLKELVSIVNEAF